MSVFRSQGRICLAIIVATLTVFALRMYAHSPQALAAVGSDFQAGRLIDDAVFVNSNSMTVQQIQAFLDAKVPLCDRWRPSSNPSYQPPWTCLKEYQENPTTGENNLGPSGRGPNGEPRQVPGGKTAAQLIWDAAQAHRINPQVILVTLQKEQSLVTDDWPWAIQYWRAMGNRCPDGPGGAKCDPAYAGFGKQVDGGTWQFRHDFDGIGTPDFWAPYYPGWNNILYQDPDNNPNCGTKTVYIENQATAVLYKYTPYTPNQAALNNLYGSGDSCSSYGNRNFWRLFTDWFGPTIVVGKIWYGWSDISVDSQGDVATIPVRLVRAPKSPIQIVFKTSDSAPIEITKNRSLFFNSSNWDKYQNIEIRGTANATSNRTEYLQVEKIFGDDPEFSQVSINYFDKLPLYFQNNKDGPSQLTRLYSASQGKHAYVTNGLELTGYLNAGYVQEMTLGSECSASNETPLVINNALGRVETFSQKFVTPLPIQGNLGILYSNKQGSKNVFLLQKSDGDTLLTTDVAEKEFAQSIGYGYITVFMLCENDTVNVYRMFDQKFNRHFYTNDPYERNFASTLGFTYESIAFSYRTSLNSAPVYRMYRASTNSHFYTSSEDEKNSAESQGFAFEGIAWKGSFVESGTSQKVSRLYSASRARHLYSSDPNEITIAQTIGYRLEGTAFIENR